MHTLVCIVCIVYWLALLVHILIHTVCSLHAARGIDHVVTDLDRPDTNHNIRL